MQKLLTKLSMFRTDRRRNRRSFCNQ